MARIKKAGTDTLVWISARETEGWARRWPCSALAGRRVFARFAENGDLVDLAVDGRSVDGPANELTALLEDFLPATAKGE